MGCRQAVRQRVLIPPYPGSNPGTPAIFLDGQLEVEFDPGYMPRFESSTPAIFLDGNGIMKNLMGCRQAVRQRVLIPPYPGSNPGTPAIFLMVSWKLNLFPAICPGSNPAPQPPLLQIKFQMAM